MCCLGLEREDPFRTAGKMDKPLRCWLLDSQRDQKSPLRRCFKPRPPLSAGCAGFASGCRSRSEALNFEPQATVRPLVRMPTDRHTATGTCEFGRAVNIVLESHCKKIRHER